MNLRFGSRHFAALLTPSGIHLIEYRRGARRLQIVQYVHDATPLPGGADASTRLADVLEANGGSGGRVAVAIGGFGSYYHILSLPPAPAEILTPVVIRELRHIYPDLRDAAIGFRRTSLEADEAKKGEPRTEREHQLLVGMVPRDLIGHLQETLSTRRITLEHVTILPRAVQRVHQAFVGSDDPMALVMTVPGSPLLGFFNRQALHYFASPPAIDLETEEDLLPLLEQLDRGALFIRQQFRGMRLDQLIVSTGAESPVLHEALARQGLAREITKLAPDNVPPGALAALGVALDARDDSALNLLPAPLQPAAEADPWILQLTLIGALVLVLASAWWGWSGVRAAERLESRVQVAAAEFRERIAPLESVRPIVQARRAHADRISLLSPLEASRARLQELLWGMQLAPPEVRLDSLGLRLSHGEGVWTGGVGGASYSPRTAAASRALDQWYRDLAARFPPGSVTVDHLGDATAAPSAPDSATADSLAPPRAATGRQVQLRFRFNVKLPVAEESR